jgi:hypothetical protein
VNKRLVILGVSALVFALLVLLPARASAVVVPETLTVRVVCQETSSRIAVDAAVARAKVPLAYDIPLDADGSATLLFSWKNCSEWENVGEPSEIGPMHTQEVHAYVIVGGYSVIPVPGADLTLPGIYAYTLAQYEVGMPIEALLTLAKYGLPVTEAREISIGPDAAVRHGRVVTRAQGSADDVGIEWVEYFVPATPIVFGRTNFGYHDHSEGGKRARAVTSQIYYANGVGQIVVTPDRRSVLGDFVTSEHPQLVGVFQHYDRMTATYQITSE